MRIIVYTSRGASLVRPGSTFIGRSDELDVLMSALERATEGGPLLISVAGEAGIGKTRLVQEFAVSAPESCTVLLGRCVEASDGVVAYAPFVSIVRDLLRSIGTEALRDVIPGGVADLAALTPVLDYTPRQPELARGRLFESVLTLIEHVSARSSIALVIEDLHWADADTRDLLRYLAANLGPSSVLFLATHRPPGLAQAETLPAFLATLARGMPTETLVLDRLNLDDTARLIRARVAGHVDDATVRAAHDRSQGLPLFAEGLVGADGRMRRDVPVHLTELLLTRVRELPEQCQDVLMALAVAGPRCPHTLLARVLARADADLSRVLRPAVQVGVVVADGYGYALAHDLLRAVVRDTLMLAGERLAMHRAFATALEVEPGLAEETSVAGAARAARHWRSANEHGRAIDLAWKTAQAARAQAAAPIEWTMLRQVLDLWARVPDAAERLNCDRVQVLRRAADLACWSARTDVGFDLVEAGLELTREEDAARVRAELLMQRASMRSLEMRPGVADDLALAARLAAPRSALGAEVRLQLARHAWRRGDTVTGRRLLNEVRAEVDDHSQAELALELALTAAILGEGSVSDRLAGVTMVQCEAHRLGHGWLAGLAARTWCELLMASGRYAEAYQRAREFSEQVDRASLGPYLGPDLSACQVQAALRRADPEAAAESVHEGLVEGIASVGRARLLILLAHSHLATGHTDGASACLDEVGLMLTGADADDALLTAHQAAAVELLRSRGQAGEAAATALTLLEFAGSSHELDRWEVTAAAYRALADIGRAGPPPTQTFDRLEPPEAAASVWAAAERSRAAGTDDHDTWARLAAQWLAIDRPGDAAYALCQAAVAAARIDRKLAESHLINAVEVLGNVYDVRIKGLADAVGRRLGVRTGTRQSAVMPFGLTEREVEILRHVASGESNAEIARSLFISAKTVSVHVSNILRKLEVSNRASATAVAYRLHLVEPASLHNQSSQG